MSFALERLGDLLIQEGSFLQGVKGNARRNDENEVIRNHFDEIREAAYDAKDVIETFA